MKVKTLLAQAAKCKTEKDAETLLETMKRVFAQQKQVSHLLILNAEAGMEGGQPSIQFDMALVINNQYISEIRPQLSEGELSIFIGMNHLLDKQGLNSRQWEIVEGMEEVIESQEHQTIRELCNLAVGFAVNHYAELIESVGVPKALAIKTAKACW